MSQNRTVTATFNAVPSVLTVTKAGTGTGSVTSSPSGINCGNACIADTGTFPTGSSVTLTATAASGSAFAGWSGGGCSGTGTCTTVMATSQTVVATFDTVPIALTITTSSLPDAEVGKPYDKPVQCSGGVAPFTWSVTPPPTLPDGLSLEAATCQATDKPACHVTGTPAVGTDADYTLTFTVQDSSTPTPQTDSRTIALKIKP